MTDIKYIRQEVNQKGRKYAEVARSMNHDERTVKKYADMEDWSEERPKTTRKPRVMGEARPIIDKWLEEDATKKEVSSDCQENVRCVGEGTWIQRILSFYPRLCTKRNSRWDNQQRLPYHLKAYQE